MIGYGINAFKGHAFTVYEYGALTLKDGVEISGNHFKNGCIYLDHNSSLTLGNCTKTGNTAEEEGAGITVKEVGDDPDLRQKLKTLPGAVIKIYGNKVGGEERNVYFNLWYQPYDPFFEVGSGLSPESNIGISVSDIHGNGSFLNYPTIARGTGDDPSVGFTSDNPLYAIATSRWRDEVLLVEKRDDDE